MNMTLRFQLMGKCTEKKKNNLWKVNYFYGLYIKGNVRKLKEINVAYGHIFSFSFPI